MGCRRRSLRARVREDVEHHEDEREAHEEGDDAGHDAPEGDEEERAREERDARTGDGGGVEEGELPLAAVLPWDPEAEGPYVSRGRERRGGKGSPHAAPARGAGVPARGGA